MAKSVSDIRSNIAEQVQYAAEILGSKGSHRYLVFEAVYYHKSPKKSLDEIITRCGLTKIQVQKAAADLKAKFLISKTKEAGVHFYHVDPSLKGHKNEILSLAGNPKKRKSMATKRSKTVQVVPVKEAYKKRRSSSKKPITVLYAYSNSSQRDFLYIDDEIKSVKKEILSSKFRDDIVVELSPSVDAKSLVEGLNMYRPEILHFSGHSDFAHLATSGAAMSGKLKPLTFTDLSHIIRATDDPVKVLLLNSCNSIGSANSLKDNVDILIAMNDEISDVAAIAFATSFYAALSSRQSIQTAFDQGVNAIRFSSISEAPIPEILFKDGIDPKKYTLR
ncbi:CHAT domain-containing protein [Hellea sp.]|nr:CHAT domain-containing protein [Hellea sp.]